MRILFVLNTVALYGATRSAIDLACGLKRLGQEIYFFIPKESRMDERHALKNEMDKYGKEDIFKPYIEEGMTVVEFGSGGGYLLERICAKEKIGIEINDKARETAKARGVNTVKNISDIPDAYADIIISTSVLEHVLNPFGALTELRNKLKEGGKIVFHVPNESCSREYERSEINNHLYTWNCLNLGNLFKAAGYFVYSVQNVQEVWPKYFLQIENEVSRELFESICEIGGKRLMRTGV